MCTPQFLSSPLLSSNISMNSQSNKMSMEESQAYQSYEVLLRSINIDIPLSAHRNECEPFDQVNNDMEASLTTDELLSMMESSSLELSDNSNDLPRYFSESSTVTPHIPNLPLESFFYGTVPLSPSLKGTSRKNYPSAPSSPTHFNSINEKKLTIFDKTTGRERRPLLHEFIRLLLENDEYSHIAEYIDREQGIFKLHKPKEVATFWKQIKGRNSDAKMTYDKLARAIRYYYSSGIMHSSPGRFTFRFGVKSGFGTTWWPVV